MIRARLISTCKSLYEGAAPFPFLRGTIDSPRLRLIGGGGVVNLNNHMLPNTPIRTSASLSEGNYETIPNSSSVVHKCNCVDGISEKQSHELLELWNFENGKMHTSDEDKQKFSEMLKNIDKIDNSSFERYLEHEKYEREHSEHQTGYLCINSAEELAYVVDRYLIKKKEGESH